ncbi:MAG TPA: AAA domain-containing protein [Patescibacteria group bacterium]|nr:AAA domain-containing protein [Patescibacteria group bacterium]
MNIEKHLILIKGEDKTEEIYHCESSNGKWRVIYKNNSTEYTYNFFNVEWHKFVQFINNETKIIYNNNQPLSGIAKIIDFGKYIKIIFKTGYKKVYDRSSIIIEETCLANKTANDCFEYLKKLADHVSIKSEEDLSFLSKQYDRISTISPRSVLSAYLEGKPLKNQNNYIWTIFPFGFNLSQKAATEKALTEQVSVIEGPPGTGKTQTILNIIANALIANKTVAVVSNNNSATANVLEKLRKYGIDFIAAYLGNSENKEKFFAEQKNTYPNMSDWLLANTDFQSIKTRLNEFQRKLNEMLEYKNKLAVLKQQLSGLQTEYEYFNRYYIESNGKPMQLRSFLGLNADRVLTIMIEYQQKAEKGELKLSEKLYNLLVFGIYSLRFYDNAPEAIITYLQKTYYEQKMKELNRKIELLSNKLDNYNFDNAMKTYSEDSMILFKAKLAERFKSTANRAVFDKDATWKNFDSFIKEYPVILSTTHSLRNCACENYLFDYVIIDEASQVDLVSGALTLTCAKNAVIVGDIKQLPNVVTPEVAKVTDQIFDSFKLDRAYNYANNSLLSSIISLYEDIPKTLLKEHYRCHPKIIGFCNQKFYNNELIILTNEAENDKPLMLYKTAKGNHARGKLNQRQIDVIFEEIIPDQKIDADKQSVGIISPYRLQINELKKVIGERNIEADTVHKYQGREKDVIILTTVANEIAVNDFVDDSNLINVAVSRAVDKLIVVVADGSDEWKGTNVGDLVRYIKYNNYEVIESQIYSVFDLLYSSYSEKLLAVMKSRKYISEYKSEDLMNVVIEKVLSLPEFQGLSHVMYQPLKMLIKDPVKLNEEECRYAMNILTHTDFVIFNKIDKLPVLVVEVDGYAYHANNPKQVKRDNLKNEILKKYDIPILRIKTNESGEKEKLRRKLVEILKLE